MNLADSLVMELTHEGAGTRKVLERVPTDKFSWSPHEKSMDFGHLASHLAEIPGWIAMILGQDELVMDPDTFEGFAASSTEELLTTFDAGLASATEMLGAASNESLAAIWKMKMGDQMNIEMPRVAVIRARVLHHLIHHRAQLTVYLRLNDLPVPSLYGPSADEAG